MKRPAIFLLIILWGHLLSAVEPGGAQKPNLLLILTDDMGYGDLGCYGGKDIPTPHLDQLAAQGTRFTSAYATAPICVPSRMGLMSGKFPARFGVFNNVYGLQQNQIWIQQTTLADVLKKQGYRTANIGKWHLSGNSTFQFKPPHERGFDEFVGITGGMNTFWKGTGLARFKDGKYELFDAPDYLTDFFGAEACDFIQRVHTKNQESGTKNKEPFFLYLAFNAPHAPLHGRDEDQAAIAAKDISADRRIYAAMVHAVDRNVGHVMAKLHDLGLAENTLTIFLNDNGGGGNNAAGHTRNTAVNRPHRGHKFDVWEGGVRVPFIAHWPGRIPVGKVFDGMVSSMDVFPTFAKAAATVPADLDGVDLMPFVKGEKSGSPHETLCWQQEVWSRPNERKPGPGYPAPAYNLAIRNGKWKAVKQDQPFDGTNQGRAWELYDLTQDPAELNDLATEFPGKVKELSEAFFAWQKQMPRPVQTTALLKK